MWGMFSWPLIPSKIVTDFMATVYSHLGEHLQQVTRHISLKAPDGTRNRTASFYCFSGSHSLHLYQASFRLWWKKMFILRMNVYVIRIKTWWVMQLKKKIIHNSYHSMSPACFLYLIVHCVFSVRTILHFSERPQVEFRLNTVVLSSGSLFFSLLKFSSLSCS